MNNETIANTLAGQKTKITKRMIDKKTVTDWYIEGEEQLELGIVDEIISNIDDLL